MKEWERIQAVIKRADLIMLATEQRDLMGMDEATTVWPGGARPHEKRLPRPMSMEFAEKAFLHLYDELQAKTATSKIQAARALLGGAR